MAGDKKPEADILASAHLARRSKRRRALQITALVALMAALLLLFFLVQWNMNRNYAYQTSSVTVDQVQLIIESNEERQATLTDSLKEDYTTRARAVSYILDLDPKTESNVFELMKIAELIGVDEVNLFDERGVIYSGSNSRYYGFSFDSGEQMSWFKPMLDDKTLSMCQDVTPNTAEGKAMMYAICWNDAGTRMTQVGIEPVRLLAELRASSMSEIIASMPSYPGLFVLVADAQTGEIAGATDEDLIGSTLSQAGIDPNAVKAGAISEFEATVNGRPSYCAAQESGEIVVVAAQSVEAVNAGIDRTMLVVAACFLIAAVVFTFIVRRLLAVILEEQRNASTDQMTDFLNRRAYEAMLKKDSIKQNGESLVYISMDLNALKETNDSMGHAAGDELIKGAAACMNRCFGSYGSIYRIGGDEFAALVYADEEGLKAMLGDFDEAQASWTAKHGVQLSVSYGCASVSEFPDKTLSDIAKIADARMYEAKERHYGQPA